jgi:hypothetical protein
MRRWWVTIALLLSVGVNVGLLAAVATRKLAARDRERPLPGPMEPRPPGPSIQNPGEEPLPRVHRLADHLGLEGKERSRFLDLQRQFFEETLRVRMHLAETQREVRRELMADEPDRQRIDTLLKEAARDYLALERALAKNVVATRAVLSPAQEEEYLRIISRLRPQGPRGLGAQPPPRRRPPPPWRDRDRFPHDRGGFPEGEPLPPPEHEPP